MTEKSATAAGEFGAEQLAAESRSNAPRKKILTKQNIFCWAIVSIPLLGFLIFSGFTVIFSFAAMFCDMEYNQLDTLTWNSFQNFKDVVEQFTMEDGRLGNSLVTTVIIASAQFVSLAIALTIAAFLSQSVKGTRLFQTLYFIPYICSSVAVAIMWKMIFGSGGALNALLGIEDLNWLNNLEHPRTLTFAIFVSIIWQAPGYGIVMYCSSFKAINPALYEAASLDGANAWHKFWHITLPGISTITFFLILAGITAGLTTFDAARVMAPLTWEGNAGPDNAGLTLMYYIYIEGVLFGNMGYASVLSWMLFVVMMIPSVFLIKHRILSLEDK